MFSGDINQDGIIDASDLSKADNDSYNGVTEGLWIRMLREIIL